MNRPDPSPAETERLRRQEQRDLAVQRRVRAQKAINFIYYLVGSLGILLLLRFVLRLAGANPENVFANFIYGFSGIFTAPFETLFATPEINQGHAFDVNAIVAIIAYAVLAWLAARLVRIVADDGSSA